MTKKFSSRPHHSNSLTSGGQNPPSPEYNLFFDNINFSLNQLLGDSLKLTSYTLATVPDVAANLSGMIFVSDESGGPAPAWSDGTDWRRFSDGAVIS